MKRTLCTIAAVLLTAVTVVAIPASADAATSNARHGNDWE